MKQLDLDDPRPPFQQVAALLREEIRAGTYKPGMQLPSGSELAKRFKVARQTVQNAIKELKGDGLVASRQGSGVYVRYLTPAPTGLEAALADAFRIGRAEIDYLGTNPLELVSALRSEVEDVRSGPSRRVYASVCVLSPVRPGATPNQVELELTGVGDLRRLAQEAESDNAVQVEIEERRTPRTPMFELYRVNGVTFVAFVDPWNDEHDRDFQPYPAAPSLADRGIGPADVFVSLWKQADNDGAGSS